MTLSNSLLSSAVTTVIIVIVFGGGEGTVISYSTDIGTVVDILFRGMLDTAYAAHGILSLTATDSIDDTYVGPNLEGAEKITTFKSGGNTYAVVVVNDGNGVQILDITDPYDITAADSIEDDPNLELEGASDVDIFESGGNTYAAVTSYFDDGVQILDITDPYDITAAGSIDDEDDPDLELNGIESIAIFESGGNTYAAVASFFDDGVQILDITDPYDITATGSIDDEDDPDLKLYGAFDITIFNSSGHTYAAVTSYFDDGVQILNITDPYDITAAGSINLASAAGITTFKSGIHTYAAVAILRNTGIVHILNITDLSNIVVTDSITDDGSLKLRGAIDITAFESDSHTYAAVTSSSGEGVQILNITDPSDITAAGSIGNMDDTDLDLSGAHGITTFESGIHTYAAVASYFDDRVQILNITDPYKITAADSISHQSDTVLSIANGIATFESGGNTYAAVTSSHENGVQMLDITDPYGITLTDSITDNGNLTTLRGALGITTFKSGDNTYAAVASPDDDGVQILDVTDPYDIIPTDSITDAEKDYFTLGGASGITTFNSSGHTYVAVTAADDKGFDILNVTDPYDITDIIGIVDSSFSDARGITTFKLGNNTYVAVTSHDINRVRILDITRTITPIGGITDNDSLTLKGASGIATFESGNSTYVAVAARGDHGIQILNVTDPFHITPAGSIDDADDTDLELEGANDIATFESDGNIYAAVASINDDGIQILNITDPYIIIPIGSITDDGNMKLKGAHSIATFKSGNYTHVAVVGRADNGVQIIRIGIGDDATRPTITIPDPPFVTISVGDPYDDSDITCTDHVDPSPTLTPDIVVGTHSSVGYHIVTYSCTDAAGNVAEQMTRAVIVQPTPDTDPPGIMILGNTTETITVRSSYADAGATCSDAGSDITDRIIFVTTVDTTMAGTYAVVYSCADVSGNQRIELRTVIVQAMPVTPPPDNTPPTDTTPPIIMILGNTTETITVRSSYADAGATCSDAGSDITHRMIPVDTVIPTMAGTYAVVYSCADVSGNQRIELRTVIVQAMSGTPPPDNTPPTDTTPPIIMILGNTTETITVRSSYADAGATCSDAGSDITHRMIPVDTVIPTMAGTYAVVYSCADVSGNQRIELRTVIVQAMPVTPPPDNTPPTDTTPPIIMILGNTTETITVRSSYADAGATCSDAGSDITHRMIPVDTVIPTMAGTYAVVYSCADVSGNQRIELRTVIVQAMSGTPPPDNTPPTDTTPPIIMILGNTTETITVRSSYADAGATCSDAGSDITHRMIPVDTVIPTMAGTYAVVYSCADVSGNQRIELRTVIVQAMPVTPPPDNTPPTDTTPPIIMILGNTTETITVRSSYADAGATCSDAGSDITHRMIPVDTVIPTMAGTYAVVYSCADVSGNQRIELRTVIVQAMSGTPPPDNTPPTDTTPPIIMILGNTTETITVRSSYADAGATCSDAGSDITHRMIPVDTVIPTMAGTYAVVYSCADVSGNQRIELRTVIVQAMPVTPPPVTPPPAISDTDSSSQRRSGTQNYLIVDTNITIDGQSYRVGSGTVIKPHDVMTGQATDIAFTAYSASDIIHFTVYLNLHGNDITYSNSDTYISYDHGTVQIHDPHGFISDASITVTEDSEQPIKNIIDTLVEFDGEMGLTNMVVHIWNDDRRSELIKVFDALDITSGTEVLPDPEPQILPDPEPQILPDPEPQILPDPEPQIYNGTAATTPPDTELSDAETLSIIRIWAGFEHGSVTDDELLQALNLDYHDNHIPNWVITELAVLVSKGSVTADEFVLALQYVLTHA